MPDKVYIITIKIGAESFNLCFQHMDEALEIHNKIFMAALDCDNAPFKITMKEDYGDE